MFTGIIQAVGEVQSLIGKDGDMRLTVRSADLQLEAVQLGDSIAVNGVCLTAINLSADTFSADVSLETINRSSLGQLKPGSSVNLEKALTLSTPLGGHLVSGHVDGLATLVKRQEDARSIRFEFSAPAELAHYIAEKGSVTIDGTSLTVNHVNGQVFGVNIVPHTQNKTIFQYYQSGTRVNLEVDIIARYLERLLTGAQSQPSDSRLLETLIQSGFVKN